MSDPHTKDEAARIWQLREQLLTAMLACNRAGEHTHTGRGPPMDCERCKANAAYDAISDALAEAEGDEWPDVINC